MLPIEKLREAAVLLLIGGAKNFISFLKEDQSINESSKVAVRSIRKILIWNPIFQKLNRGAACSNLFIAFQNRQSDNHTQFTVWRDWSGVQRCEISHGLNFFFWFRACINTSWKPAASSLQGFWFCFCELVLLGFFCIHCLVCCLSIASKLWVFYDLLQHLWKSSGTTSAVCTYSLTNRTNIDINSV